MIKVYRRIESGTESQSPSGQLPCLARDTNVLSKHLEQLAEETNRSHLPHHHNWDGLHQRIQLRCSVMDSVKGEAEVEDVEQIGGHFRFLRTACPTWYPSIIAEGLRVTELAMGTALAVSHS